MPDDDLLVMSGDLGDAPPPDSAVTFWDALEAHVADVDGALNCPLRVARAEEGTSLPYAEYDRPDASASGGWNTAGEATWDGQFTLAIYAASRAEADRLARALARKDGGPRTLFDAPLVFQDGQLVLLRPAAIHGAELDPDPGPAGEDCYAARATFNYKIHV